MLSLPLLHDNDTGIGFRTATAENSQQYDSHWFEVVYHCQDHVNEHGTTRDTSTRRKTSRPVSPLAPKFPHDLRDNQYISLASHGRIWGKKDDRTWLHCKFRKICQNGYTKTSLIWWFEQDNSAATGVHMSASHL